MVVRKLEVRGRLPRTVISSQSKVLIKLVGANQFPWVHFPVGVPKRLESRECFNEFRAEHFRKQFSAGLTVAVFAGKRSTE